MATAPSPNDLTRQQLDELDALLQKMLTVPIAVDPPPTASPAPPAMAQPPLPPSWRIDPPQPVPSSDGLGGTKRSASQPVQPAASLAHLSLDDPPPLRFEPPASPPTPTPTPPPKAAKPASAPAPKPVPLAVTAPKVVPTPVPVPKPVAQPPRAVTPAPAAPPVPLVFLPFVALNGLFDNICGMFGPPGRLFRAGFVKQLYGLAGLGLMVYTGLHVAQVQGWLTLPVALPWPR